MKPTLILTVGLPRSGKSTWARKSGHPVVSPDAIRLALHGQPYISSAEPIVWATAKLMVSALFNAGHLVVVLDATNTTKSRRKEWESSEWYVSYQEFKTSEKECIERAKATNQEYLIPVIREQARKFEPI